jgi:hypothetical protein
MENSLRIVLWNANGLSNHKLNLQNLLHFNRRNLIRLQRNLVDYNIKIMKHQGTWEMRK